MNPEFTIVEYDPSYAESLADMWTRSGDSWGGFNVDMTPESVRREEELSATVNSYLAILNNEVVGYCSIGKWTQDEGALYIETLNVRPDLHGKKIGKALLLKSVARTAELGWGRLDLDTWPGNTKAVPLYKRTGFFWEERDTEVYCVNYIPSILKNELVSDFFARADWYMDSTRPIELKPDGQEVNKFTYFTYSWENNGEALSIEYARRGRGLRKISRNDFDIEMTVENRDLVFGREYEVRFNFQNRSGSPLDVGIEGVNDKNLTFDFSHTGQVETSLEVTARFAVGDIAKDQSDWKTHPRVCARISLGGRGALFAIGVVPKFPAGIRFHDPKMPSFGKQDGIGYLDVESNIKADFTFEIEDGDGVRFQCPTDTFSFNEDERKSIEIPLEIDHSCVYAGFVTAVATNPDGEVIRYKREIGGLFTLPGGVFEGERPENRDERSVVMGVGSHVAGLKLERDSHINALSVSAIGRHGSIQFFQFKLGKPYDDEFIRTPALSVDVVEQSDGRMMDARYRSETYPDVEITMHTKIEYGGLIRRWFSCKNTSSAPLADDLFLSETFRFNEEDTVYPVDGQIIETRRDSSAGHGLWEGERITENWLFSRNENCTFALFWEPELDVKTGGWTLLSEHNFGILPPGEEKNSPVITAAVAIFTTWNECRSYAHGRKMDVEPVEEGLEMAVNGHNPFVPSEYSVELIEHRLTSFDGTISVKNAGTQKFARKNGEKKASFNAHADPGSRTETVVAQIDLVPTSYERSRVVFPKGSGDIQVDTGTLEGFATVSATNGDISVRTAPEYAPGLLSCTYLGEEWLDTDFPNLGPRDWWNPWIGGLMVYPAMLEGRPLLREPAKASPVELTDSKGNLWKGIRIGVEFREHDDIQGLSYDQYFMLLPGVPVLAVQAEIHQNTGTYFKDFVLTCDLFPRITEQTTDTAMVYLNREGQAARLSSGHEELTIRPESTIMVTGSTRESKMLFFADRRQTRVQCETQKKSSAIKTYDSVTCPAGGRKTIAPKFVVFADSCLEEELLSDLCYIDLLANIGNER